MTLGTLTCGGMAASALTVGDTPWPFVGVLLLLGAFFAWGMVTRFHTVIIHERGLVWRHRRERRLMTFEQIASFQVSEHGVVVDAGDELLVANTLSYSESERQQLADALRARVPEREKGTAD